MMSSMTPDPDTRRFTLKDLRRRAAAGERTAWLTCYDATTARWLWRGGLRAMLVGDTAAEMILGHDSTLPAPLEVMLALTAAVRRGAPNAFVMGDMPFGSYQCGDDAAMRAATRFLAEAGADAVKLELEASGAPLVARMSRAGIPVVAHLGSRPQAVRLAGAYQASGRDPEAARTILETARRMIEAGASMLLLEAIPEPLAEEVTRLAEQAGPGGAPVPVIVCGAGAAGHGEVLVLHDLLGLTDWQPPFARPRADLATPLARAVAEWVQSVEAG